MGFKYIRIVSPKRRILMNQSNTRRLAAIMFTDIVGYTALMQQDESQAARVRARHREVFNQSHQQFNGEILQYFGDGTLSIFQSSVEAVQCAIAIQEQLQQAEKVPLRIGLHQGEIVFDGTDIYGDSVNLASRVESMGVAGAVLLSKKVNEELKNHPEISTTSLGNFILKNIEEPVEVFAIKKKGIKMPMRSELKGKQQPVTKTIAVLPFVNLSADADNEYFSDGMTEEIINALSKIKELKVTSRTSSFFFKNKNVPIQQIGEELNVSTILEGSIRLAGKKMRITAQLIDVAEDFHFWSQKFDRSIEDLFAVQDEISLLIADKLREHLGHFEIEEQLVKNPEIPVNAYQQYLKGRYHILKMTKQDLETGIAIFENLTQQQPDYALAYLGMHLGYNLQGVMGLIPPEEAFRTGHPHLQKAIEIDETLPECQIHLSYDALLQKWNLPATYQHLQNAYNIRPTVEYYQSMTSALAAERKFEAAINYNATAMQLDPFSEINFHLRGFIHYAQEEYETALEWFDKAIELKPSFLVTSFYKGQALILSGKANAALTLFQHLPDDEGEDITKLGFITLAYATLGAKNPTNAGIEKLKMALATPSVSKAVSALILIYAMLDQLDKSLKMVAKGIELHMPMMVYIYTEPILKKLYPLPEFQELGKQVLSIAATPTYKKRKYKKALFTKEQLLNYSQQLEQLMQQEQPFLNANLTLRELAEMMNLPPNQMSQLLNEGFDKNFSEFVNSYRLEVFKTKITDPANSHYTILGLAYESGFNSKTVFNSFFKKMMGQTPKAYQKMILGK